MKNTFYLIALTLTLFSTSCQKSQKIAFVDNVKVINEYQEKKDMEAALQLKIDAFQQSTDSLRQAFQEEIGAAEVRAARMSQSQIQQLSQELQQKEQFLSQQIQAQQQALANESQANNDTLIERIKTFIKDFAVTNNFTFILGSNDAGSVLYGAEPNDLTETILEALNTAYEAKQ
jgi:outer membrane protein